MATDSTVAAPLQKDPARQESAARHPCERDQGVYRGERKRDRPPRDRVAQNVQDNCRHDGARHHGHHHLATDVSDDRPIQAEHPEHQYAGEDRADVQPRITLESVRQRVVLERESEPQCPDDGDDVSDHHDHAFGRARQSADSSEHSVRMVAHARPWRQHRNGRAARLCGRPHGRSTRGPGAPAQGRRSRRPTRVRARTSSPPETGLQKRCDAAPPVGGRWCGPAVRQPR